MFCTKCGANNEDNNVFCKQCGARLTKPVPNSAGNQSVSVSSRVVQAHVPMNIMLMVGGVVIVIAILVGGYLKLAGMKTGEKDIIAIDGIDSELIYEISDEDIYDISLREDTNGSVKDYASATGNDTNIEGFDTDDVQMSELSIIESSKLLKEQTRAQNKEALLEIINDDSLTKDAKQDAINSMITLTETAQKESDAQLLLEAKGYTQTVVSISGDVADVMIEAPSLTDAQTAQIIDIVQRKTDIVSEKIIITVVSGE